MAAERASALSDPDKDVPVPTGPPPPTIKFSWRNTVPCPRRVYITDTAQAEIEMSIFQGPCGLDIEWKPTFVKGGAENPVALLQLANADSILLIHLHRIRVFPKNLKTFLEDPLIVKAGVGIQGDATKMFRDYRVDIRGCVDLSYLARTVDNARWKGSYSQPIGLARLIATYEDRLLVKGKITRSNWERNQLSVEQQEYAANDAHAGLVLFMRFFGMLPALPHTVNPSWYSFHTFRGRPCELSGMTWAPFNPQYDPGPPPPPKPRKVKDAAKDGQTATAEPNSPTTDLAPTRGKPHDSHRKRPRDSFADPKSEGFKRQTGPSRTVASLV